MKQSFTLKALAFGLAAVTTLGASAARPQLPAEVTMADKGTLSLGKTMSKEVARTSRASQTIANPAFNKIRPAIERIDLTAQAASRAIDPYGAWEDAGTLEYTFTQLSKNQLIDASASVKTYPYQKRVHRQNEQNFQIKVANWGEFTAEEGGGIGLTGCELILTVTPVQTSSGKTLGVVTTAQEGIDLGWQVNFGTATAPMLIDMYYYDAYTWIQNVAKFDEEVTSSVIANYYGSSIYDYSTGQFELLPSYAGSSDSENINAGLEWGQLNADKTGYTEMWYDYIQLSGKFYNYDFDINSDAGYFYRNAGETAGYYKAPFELNDNAIGMAKIVKGKADALDKQTIFNEMVDAMNAPTADMAVFTSPEGWFDLAVNQYEDGDYTLFFGVGKAPEADGNISIEGGYIALVLEGAEFVLDGFAKYNDAIMPGFLAMFGAKLEDLGFPSEYSTTCQVEKSETEAGTYRLRAPYAEYPLGGKLDYMQELDYLYYNVADPNKAIIEPSMLGVINQARLTSNGPLKTFVMGASSTSAATGLEINNGFGVFANNRLTLPGTNYTTTIDGKEKPLGPLSTIFWNITDGNAMYTIVEKPQDFLIETGAVDAIENVEASTDANAPVEYYNLQGQKVANPAAGQLVIKKQGGKVTKMIAQ